MRRFARPSVAFSLLVCVLFALPAIAQEFEGRWEGTVNPPGQTVPLKLNLKKAGSGWEGSVEGRSETRPLQSVSVNGQNLKFEVQAPQGLVSFEGRLEADKITGNANMAGTVFPFQLERRAVAAAAAAAAPARAPLPEGMIPRDVLFGNPEKASPQISPDGKRLAYLAPKDNVLNVWVRTIGSSDDQVITSDKKRGVRFFAWQYDAEHVVYIQDKDGDENWHLYQTNLKSKTTRDLTPFEGVQARFTAYDHKFPDQILVSLNVRDRRQHDVYRLNLKNGALDLDTQNPGDVIGFVADHNLQVRAAQAFAPDGSVVIRVRDAASSSTTERYAPGPWREFQRWPSEDNLGGVVGFTPDNKRLRAISSVSANAARLVEIDIASGKSAVVAEDPDYDVGATMVNDKTKKIEAVQFVRARRDWKVLDKSIQADIDAIRKVRDGDFSISSRDLEDKTWLVSYIEDDAPVYYYSFDRPTKKATLLFSNRPQLERYKLAEMKPIRFESRDGMVIHGYLTMPPGVTKNAPMVMDVHGGPWARDIWGLNSNAQWLSNRGYAVLQVNFRGSTGYGKKFVNAGDREWGAKMHNDLLDAKKWAIAQGYADANKICIFGGSYGGYATLVGLTFTPGEFTCGVDIVGPSNLITLINTIPPYWEPIKAIFNKRVGDVKTEEEFLKSRSPLFKADQITKPLLIAQGANDPRVKQAESDQIVAAMRKNNKPVEYLVFPDEGHGFARPENRLAFFAAAEQFLVRQLGGKAEPPSAAEAKLLESIKK